MLILYAVTLLMMGVPALTMHINTIVDELGMMSNAAVLSGRNWHTGVIATGGYYYKYGLAFVWALPYVLLNDSVAVYKACGFINAAFFSTIPVMVYYISRRYLNIKKQSHAALLAMTATCLGDTMYYTTNMRADYMLAVLNWGCALVLLNGMEAGKNGQKEKQKYYSILLAFLAVYSYACHSRGIVAVIAVTMTIAVIRIITKKDCVRYPAYFISLAGFLLIDKVLQILFREAIWRGQAAHATGLSAETFHILLTRPGMSSYLKTAIGWLYSTFTSTAGLACAGLLGCLIMVVLMFRRSEKLDAGEMVLALFGGLSYAGSFAVGSLFFLDSTYKIFTGKSSSRLDRIVFGRYTCCACGLLVLMAAYILIWKKDIFGIRAKLISVFGYVSVFLLFAWKAAPVLDGKTILRKGLGVLGVFIQPASPAMNVKKDDVSKDLLFFGIVMFGIFLLMLVLSAGKRAWTLCVISVVTGVTLYGYNTYIITYAQDAKRFRLMTGVRDTMNSLGDIYEEYSTVYVQSPIVPSKSWQVLLMDYSIVTKKYAGLEEYENAFIVSGNLPDIDDLTPGSYYILDDVNYDEKTGDIVYVKGEDLNHALEERGVPTSLYAAVSGQ